MKDLKGKRYHRVDLGKIISIINGGNKTGIVQKKG